jgi:hypothetical protein
METTPYGKKGLKLFFAIWKLPLKIKIRSIRKNPRTIKLYTRYVIKM